MAEEKYRTEQERVDNQTMKIENKNLIGSGFIKHPPQEKRPQQPLNEQFQDNRRGRYPNYNRRGRDSSYYHHRDYRPRGPYQPSRYQNYDYRNGGGGGGGRSYYGQYRPRGNERGRGGGYHGYQNNSYRSGEWMGPSPRHQYRSWNQNYHGYHREMPRDMHRGPHQQYSQFPYEHSYQQSNWQQRQQPPHESNEDVQKKEAPASKVMEVENAQTAETPDVVV